MSSHPFQRAFRNAAGCVLILPIRDGRSRIGAALIRAALTTMYPPDRDVLLTKNPRLRPYCKEAS